MTFDSEVTFQNHPQLVSFNVTLDLRCFHTSIVIELSLTYRLINAFNIKKSIYKHVYLFDYDILNMFEHLFSALFSERTTGKLESP